MKTITLTYMLAAIATLASCSNEELYTASHSRSDSIAFSSECAGSRGEDGANVAPSLAGIGQLISENGTDSLYVTALCQDWETASETSSRASNGVAETRLADINDFYATCVRRNSTGNPVDYYFQDKLYSKSGDVFQLPEGGVYYWAGTAAEDYDFYTYSTLPTGAASTSSAPNAPSFSYTVGADNQHDIVTAKYLGAPANWGQVVPLTFRHIMTAIRFKAANDVLPGQITSIELSGIKNSGTFTFSCDLRSDDSWSNGDTETTYSIAPTDVNISGGESGNHTVTPDEFIGTFMLLPQTLGENARITVKFKDAYSNTEFTLSMSLSGYVWQMGQVITYVISTSQIEATPVFEVSSSNAESLTHDGGNVNFSVTSRIQLTGTQGTEGTYAVPWTAKVGTYINNVFTAAEESDYPWLDISALSGAGTNAGSQSAIAVEQYIRGRVADGDTHLAALKASATAASSSESSPYDLATKGGTTSENTANCYIVDGAGWYSFPLACGNAVKDGEVNAAAFAFSPTMTGWSAPYSSAGTEAGGYLTAFVDGASTAVTTSNYNIPAATTAALIWSNEDKVIQNVTLDKANKRVIFYVPAETITQNNALIAVSNSAGIILWSWHIWITDRAKSANDIAVTGNDWYYVTGATNSASYTGSGILSNLSYSFMDVSLGYRDECQMQYDARTAWVQFEQTGTGKTQIIKVTQKGQSSTSTRPAQTMYYQFGRKDPFTQYVGNASSGAAADFLPFYYNNRTTHVISAANSYTYATYSSGPDIYYYSTSTYPRYWNAWNNSTDITSATFTSSSTSTSAATNQNLFNNLNNYFINDPTKVVKTIYDPSPAGYTVMPGQSVSGFTAYGMSVGTQQSGVYSFPTATWSGTSKNVNVDITSEPATSFGTTLNFHTSPMTSLGTIGSGSATIGFQNLGTLSGSLATFKNYNGYYWTANKERNITESTGTSTSDTSSLVDTYQAGCLFTFGYTIKNGGTNNNSYSYYDITIRTHAAFGVRSCCPVRCTAE